MKRQALLTFIVLIFIISGGIICYFQKQKEVQNRVEKVAKLVFENIVVKDYGKAIVEENEIYIPVELIRNYIDSDLELSDDKKRVYINISDKNLELEDKSLTKFVVENGVKINLLTKIEDNIVYIPGKLTSKIFNIDINYIETTKVVTVDRFTEEIKFGKIKEDTVLKLKNNKFSFTIDKLFKNEKVRVFKEYKDWYEVRNKVGHLGFVQRKYIDEFTKKISFNNKLNTKREDFDKSKKINITWEYVYERTPDIKNEDKIDGLDVVSPTWFKISKNGVVINNADINYVKEAHKKGYKIWGVVNNGFDPNITTNILNNEKLKNKVIAQIAFYASLYDLNGINIDFENIYYEDKSAFVKFVEDLTRILKKQNLIVSIDITVPGGSKRWSKVYDREKLAKIVDYIALMAYDEHWATSPKSGSVASIGWVERGIVKTLESVPKEKLLLGVPFYTRIWKETVDENGKIKVTSKAIPIKNVKKIIEENDAVVVWDSKAGQYFATYKKDSAVYKIWIEDAESIKLKLKLAHKYGLKGIASWRKGYEYEEIWEVIKMIKDDKKLL
ncbi:Spore germination protein YaaH [Caminicella sporogenes DSM 14501]|uniref:Spore germination protein YaaH n=1 Tax=Caminicella sporogenes DSM 14501 TaxID=1121266 RepID=A0A1M6NZ59_9FIRM|nr:glycosyl hydrolase family 18 protein [Caminicella sporogenes]RKD21588.1 hypothetical protein BET04_07660 [Caminicella sporogenes]SHK01017.1 Spore germination protein YaaH [Caminicella sporogenes DSM 14501]